MASHAVTLEGKVTHLLYRAPVDRSPLEIMRNYEDALAAAGFSLGFSCAGDDCGPRFNSLMNPAARYNGLIYDDQQRYLTARLTRPEGDVHVSGYVTSFEPENRASIKLDVVEMQPMENRMVVVEAAKMEQSLAQEGRMAIYGIVFNFDSATILPQSQAQIDQLAGSPDLAVLIVGHADGQGAFDYNLSLSQRRALTGVGVAASRLTPAGAGMVAPVATNRTGEGRAQNRRVEIVERYLAP